MTKDPPGKIIQLFLNSPLTAADAANRAGKGQFEGRLAHEWAVGPEEENSAKFSKCQVGAAQGPVDFASIRRA